MDLMQALRDRAVAKMPRVVFPEGTEPIIVEAAARVRDLGIAIPILLGPHEKIAAVGADTAGMLLVDSSSSGDAGRYAAAYSQETGFPEDAVADMLHKPVNFGAMMVGRGDADAMVAGLSHATEDVILASQMFVGMAEGVSIPSSFFIMQVPDWSGGEQGLLVFADCAVVPNPNSRELAEIAIATASSVVGLLGWTPRVAMLSFSTKGSAGHPDVSKVIEALDAVRESRPDLEIDGELQADAAIVPDVARKKVPEGSGVAGKANILIFPDLDAGNIGYKLVQRLAHATAYGPVLQGFARPVSDLSRGSTVEDIVGAATIVAAWS